MLDMESGGGMKKWLAIGVSLIKINILVVFSPTDPPHIINDRSLIRFIGFCTKMDDLGKGRIVTIFWISSFRCYYRRRPVRIKYCFQVHHKKHLIISVPMDVH